MPDSDAPLAVRSVAVRFCPSTTIDTASAPVEEFATGAICPPAITIVFTNAPVLVHAVISSAEASQPEVPHRGSGMLTPVRQPVPKLSALLAVTLISWGTRQPRLWLLVSVGPRLLPLMLTSPTFSTWMAATDGLLQDGKVLRAIVSDLSSDTGLDLWERRGARGRVYRVTILTHRPQLARRQQHYHRGRRRSRILPNR